MIELVQYHTWVKVRGGYESAIRVALVKHGGRKWLQVVAIDANKGGGLKVWKAPLTDTKYMKPLMRGRKPYPIPRALKTFRKLAKTHGASKGAKKLLKEASRESKTNQNLGAESATSPPGDHA